MKKKLILIIIIVLLIVVIGVYFIISKIQEENREYKIEEISEYKYFVVKEENQYGVIDAKGSKIIETKYKDVKIPNPEKPVFICYEENNTKILNENGNEIFTEYESVEPLRLKNISSDLMYEKSVLKYEKDGKYGIIDFTGKKLTDAIYDEIDTFQFKEGELQIKIDEKYGIINIKGKNLVKAIYDKIETDKYYEYENGYKNSGYIVSNKTDEGYRHGYVSATGKELVKPRYNDLYRIEEINSDDIYIICADNGKYGLIKNNKLIVENLYQIMNYSESGKVITALKGQKYGVISIDGNIILPFEYSQVDITGKYIYATNANGNITVFDIYGNKTNLNENQAILDIENTNYTIHIETLDNKTTYSIYKDGNKITQNEYTYIQYLFDIYFIACDSNGKLGVIDDKETTKIEFDYNSILEIENTKMVETVNNSTNTTEIYSSNMKKICELKDAILENKKDYIKLYNDNETKYISNDEKELDNTQIFTQNSIFTKKVNNKCGFADINGNMVVTYKYDDVTEVNQYGYAGIKLNDKWGVVNSKGEILVEPKYEISGKEPTFIGEYYQVVYGNGEIYYTK